MLENTKPNVRISKIFRFPIYRSPVWDWCPNIRWGPVAQVSSTPRSGAYGITSMSRLAAPLHGTGWNSASICICWRQIIFLLCPTLVRWPVLLGRAERISAGYGRPSLHSSSTHGKISVCIVTKPLDGLFWNSAGGCVCWRCSFVLLCPTLVRSLVWARFEEM